MKNGEKLGFIAIMQTIACLLVIYGHSFPPGVPGAVNDFNHRYLYLFHVPLFVFASGFLFAYTDGLGRRGYKDFIKGKAARLLTPYVVFSVLGGGARLLISSASGKLGDFGFADFLRGIFVFREAGLAHLWFLPTLFALFLISPILNSAVSSRAGTAILVVAAAALNMYRVVIFRQEAIGDIYYFLRDMSWFSFYFVMGMLFAKHRPDIARPEFFGIFASLAAFAGALLSGARFADENTPLTVSAPYKFICGALLVYLVLNLCLYLEKKKSAFWAFFDKKTYAFYIVSWPAQAAAMTAGAFLKTPYPLCCLMMFAAGILVPAGVVCAVRRFFPGEKSALLYRALGIKL